MWALLQIADTIHSMNCDECDPKTFDPDTCPYVAYLRQRQRTERCQVHDS